MSADPIYIYELRRGDEIIATGQLTHHQPLEIGHRITLAGHEGIVRALLPSLGQTPPRLVVQLLPSSEGR